MRAHFSWDLHPSLVRDAHHKAVTICINVLQSHVPRIEQCKDGDGSHCRGFSRTDPRTRSFCCALMFLHHHGIASGKGSTEPICQKMSLSLVTSSNSYRSYMLLPHCYMVLSCSRERERGARLQRNPKEGGHRIVLCFSAEERNGFPLSRLWSNVQRAKSPITWKSWRMWIRPARKLSKLSLVLLTNVDQWHPMTMRSSRPCHLNHPSCPCVSITFPFHRFPGLLGEISGAEDRVRQAARRRLRCPGVWFVICVAPWCPYVCKAGSVFAGWWNLLDRGER